jgi:hypothetical protein
MLFASELGLDPLGQTPLPVVGAGVGGACDAFYFEVILRVELLGEFRVRAAFVETLNTVGFGLLGHGGFLDQVQATFATHKRVFSVTRNEDIKT